MNNIPILLSRLRADAADLETADANHESPDRALVASAVKLMRWAAETIESQRREIEEVKRQIYEIEMLERG